jgi:hypothetical protein
VARQESDEKKNKKRSRVESPAWAIAKKNFKPKNRSEHPFPLQVFFFTLALLFMA